MKYEEVKQIVNKIKQHEPKDEKVHDNLDNYISDVEYSCCEDCYENEFDVICDIILYITNL